MARIVICGDFTTCGKGLDAVKQETAINKEIISLIKKANASFVNLECPVADMADTCIPKSGPCLSTSHSSIKYLKKCGFTHVTLANNHFCDYGKSGVRKTIQALKTEKISYVGGGLTQEEKQKPLILHIDGLSIGILNYCENEFSTIEEFGSNSLNPIHAYYDIKELCRSCNHVIVICHGGHEGYNLPSPRMVELYRYFIDLGASVVINHHQHCYSGWERHHDGKIFYGLGNFFFYDHRPKRQRNPIWNYGYIVQLDITNSEITHQLLPYQQCLKDTCVQLLDNIKEKTFHTQIEAMNSIISDPSMLQTKFDQFCKTRKADFETEFAPYTNRYMKALCRRGFLPSFLTHKRILNLWNKIRCESHRDIITNIFKTQ